MTYLTRAQQPTRNLPPLPPATLVIDMRGEGEDVVNMLAVEVKNLSDEMRQQNFSLWGELASFVAFAAPDPLSEDDVKALRAATQPAQATVVTPGANGNTDAQNAANSKTRSLTGSADQPDQASSFPPLFQVSNQAPQGDPDDDSLPPHRSFEGLIDRIDGIRNIRHNTVSRLGKDGTVGRNVKDPGVRVIFLADARRPNSLGSTAACAAYLKHFYRKLERTAAQPGQQVPINTSVICLNHRNTDQRVPPTRLIQGLRWEGRWDHLDAVILSEKYRQDIGRVDDDMQELLGELLLYVLLIISPAHAQVRPSPPEQVEVEQVDVNEEVVALPPNTYLVGLSSVENSTRWGYRLLNYGLAEQALQILRDGDLGEEQVTTHSVIENWLNRWRRLVRSALPDKAPGNVPALGAITQAEKAASPVLGIFSRNQLSLDTGTRSVRELSHYLDTLTETYSSSDEQQAAFRQQAQALPAGRETARTYTLQSAVDSVPQIQRALNEWKHGDPETPLIEAQLQAQRVLGDQNGLFLGPRKAVPRAKMQLRELGTVIEELRLKRQTRVDVKDQQAKLRQHGEMRIADLEKQVRRWPAFTSGFGKTIMAWLNAIFLLFVVACGVTLVFVWLDWFIRTHFGNVVPFIDAPLFGLTMFTVFYLILFVVLLTVLLVSIGVFGRILVNKQRSPLSVEITFCAMLLTIALAGLLIWLSYTPLGDAGVNTVLLTWYPTWLLPWISIIAFVAALVIVCTEIVYFMLWRREIEREREVIADELRRQHMSNIGEVITYIGDVLSIQLLTRAGLTDGQGGSGSYYRRVDELNTLLDEAYAHVSDQRRLAEERLGTNLPPTSLIMREELLDVAALKRGYKRLGREMEFKKSELAELAEMLLRAMGQEMPGDIEHQFREKAPLVDRELYYMQILMEALTTIALRFSMAVPASDMLTPLQNRHKELDAQVTNQLATLRPLIETLDMKVKEASLDEEESKSKPGTLKQHDITLAIQGLSSWGQMLWERKDAELSNVLASGGVMGKLVRDNRKPQTVKETLGIRTSPSGRTTAFGPYDELYLFVASSPESRKYLKDFLPDSFITDFPDTERMVLMHTLYYVARPMVLPRPAIGSAGQATVDSTIVDESPLAGVHAGGSSAAGQADDPVGSAPQA